MATPPNANTNAGAERKLAGLRAHTLAQKQATVSRLRDAIALLKAQHKPISALTIYAVSGLSYRSIARNPEALALFQKESTSLKEKHKHKLKADKHVPPEPRDPLLAYSKRKLVTRLRQEYERQEAIELQYRQLLQQVLERDITIMRLEAELALAAKKDEQGKGK